MKKEYSIIIDKQKSIEDDAVTEEVNEARAGILKQRRNIFNMKKET